MAFDKAKPVASTTLRLSNPQILENQEAIEAAVDQDHDFTTGGTQTGKHDKVTLKEQSGDQATAVNEMVLYPKDLGTAPGLFIRPQSNGTPVQLTDETGKIRSAATDMLDEDDMASDSATKTASQQSIKAYTDEQITTLSDYVDTEVTDAITEANTYTDEGLATKSGLFTPTSYIGQQSVTLPNGLIIKMGSATGNVTFSAPFPTAIVGVYTGQKGTSTRLNNIIVKNVNVSGFQFQSIEDTVYWLAMGY